MIRSQAREELIAFLDTIRRPNYSISTVGDADSLVESGLIDSLSVLEIILYIETRYRINFSVGAFDPAELGSINEILDLIERRTT